MTYLKRDNIPQVETSCDEDYVDKCLERITRAKKEEEEIENPHQSRYRCNRKNLRKEARCERHTERKEKREVYENFLRDYLADKHDCDSNGIVESLAEEDDRIEHEMAKWWDKVDKALPDPFPEDNYHTCENEETLTKIICTCETSVCVKIEETVNGSFLHIGGLEIDMKNMSIEDVLDLIRGE